MTPGDQASAPFGFRFISPLLIGTLLNPINSTMIATALVPIGRDLHVGPASTAWLVASLYLAAAVGQPTMGRIADLYGPRRVYLAGLVLVLIAGLAGAFATGLGQLIVARVVLGVGTSAAYPAAITMIRTRTDGADGADRVGGADGEGVRADEGEQSPPAPVLGMISLTSQVSAAIGPALGGLLIEVAGWRSIFLVNVPLAMTGIVLGWRWLPADRRRHRSGPASSRARGWRELDVGGVVLFAAAMTVLLLFLMRLRPHSLYLLLIVAAVLFTLLTGWELRRREPFLDVRMLARGRGLTMTYLRHALHWLVVYSITYGFTQWLEEGRGLSPAVTGLVMLPMSVAGAVTVVLVSRRARVRGPLLAGTATMILGTLTLSLLNATSPMVLLVLVTVVLGIPQGLNPVANQTALYQQAPADRIGSAAGMLRTSQYLGAIVQSSLIGAVFGGGHADDAALHRLGPVLVGFGVALFAITVFDRRLRTRTPRR